MPRSTWKGFFFDRSLSPLFFLDKNYIKIWSRRTTIGQHFVNKIFYVYNGKIFEKLLISQDMIGLKFGDLVFTKKRGKYIHLKKNKKKLSKAKKN